MGVAGEQHVAHATKARAEAERLGMGDMSKDEILTLRSVRARLK